MKEQEHASWTDPTLQMVATRNQSPVSVLTRFYVTSATAMNMSPETDEGKIEAEDLVLMSLDSQPAGASMHFIPGRPSVDALIEEHIFEGRNFVFGCGPESLRSDLANACSRAQKRVMKGKIQEVALHLEAFGW